MPKKQTQGLHLVKGEANATSPQIPTARLQKHGYIADIVVSDTAHGQIYHYVIQPEFSSDIVHWGQELSFKRALESVESFFEPYKKTA